MPAPPLESLPAIVNAVFMFFASMRITPLHYFSFWTGDKESGAPSLPPGVRMNGYVKLFVFQHAQSLFFQILRCGNNVFLCKNGTDDGDAADAAAGKLRHVIACDAADGDAGILTALQIAVSVSWLTSSASALEPVWKTAPTPR